MCDIADARAAQITALNAKYDAVLCNYLELITQHRQLRTENDALRAMIRVKEKI